MHRATSRRSFVFSKFEVNKARKFCDFPSSLLLTSLSAQGGLNFKTLDLTQVVKEITKRHECSPLASVALGRALVGNALLAAGRDEGAVCQLTFDGNGPLRAINTEVSFSSDVGFVKGYVENPLATLPLVNGLLDVSGGIGIGVLHVTRVHPARKDKLQQGTTMLETSEVGEDLVVYLLSSEQINSAMGLAVQIDMHGSVNGAVGYLCTVMPGCSEEELSIAETNISSVKHLNKLVMEDKKTVHDVMSILTENLGETYRNQSRLIAKCSCSEEKFLQSFKLLGQKELREIINKNEKDENIRCHWCSTVMSISPCSLKPLLLHRRSSSPGDMSQETKASKDN